MAPLPTDCRLISRPSLYSVETTWMRTNAGLNFRMASSVRGCRLAEGSDGSAAPNCCVTSRDEQQTASRQAEVLKQRTVSMSSAFAREQGARNAQIGAVAMQRLLHGMAI